MNNYYIYIYLNPLSPGSHGFKEQPFYVGKGKKDRAYRHLKLCFNKHNKKGYRRLFYQKLRKLLSLDISPTILIYKNNLTEEEAFIIEKTLIKKIGRRIYKEGTLCNNSLGGEGPSGTSTPRFKVNVYNNEGKLIDTQNSVKECSKKYNIKELHIYKSCSIRVKNPYKGLRFRKDIDNIKKLCTNDEIIKRKKCKHKVISHKGKPVYQYSLEGNLLDVFPNAHIASKKLEIGLSSIHNNLANRSKTCKNFKFKN